MEVLTHIIFYFLVIIPSATVHEVAHGFVANLLGDDTAKRLGRLTLNPLRHIDMVGSILLPVLLMVSTGGTFMFAYAKPVPYNPYNLRSHADEVKIALAGPAANLALALIFGMLARFALIIPEISSMAVFFGIVVVANIVLAVFNLVPIPPLDGSKLLLFLLPQEQIHLRMFLNQYGIILLFMFIFWGVGFIAPIIGFFVRLILGGELSGFIF